MRRQTHLEQLSPRMQVFVMEYAADGNATRAAREAGYKGSNLDSLACGLLKKAHVREALTEVMKPVLDGALLTVENIAQQLSNFLFRNLIPFLDDEGYLNCSLRELPESIQQAIESWEADSEYDPETGELTGQKIKVKLVSKAKALELAMKYRQMILPATVNVQQNNINGVDAEEFWRQFNARANQVPPDVIEGKFKELTDG
jgi:hypothetical protein